ncbi:FtsX-like permease family protein [Cyanobacterium stanieri LEGE 03274]|uniref:FtsX-like permease family protein n=1 Tax=Cyanobacterium stanieri LEGE 03274 TaxID=1828756 RepID=A0ABR9V4C1_9CHRO|nr:FtsX-like permease family protein [Cyanobacterium stanieri LEGE 03274]
MKTPLAWLQLSHERMRLLIALAGIGFADILMFMQLGFRGALLDSATLIHEKIEADLVLISPQSEAIHLMKPFSRRGLYQTLHLEEVEFVAPIYISLGDWKNPETGQVRTIMAMGFNPSHSILDLPLVNKNLDEIKLSDTFLFDVASRPEFGRVESLYESQGEVKTEINNRNIKVNGLFSLGPSFAVDGTVITSDTNILRTFPERSSGNIEVGLVKLKDNVDPLMVKDRLNSFLGADVRVLTHQEFIDFEQGYWSNSTPIGFIFLLGAGMGFVVGTVIVYQILYADVSDHLPEYATLKAMGYGDNYFLVLVFQEAIILAILGFIPGFLISSGLYGLTKTATALPLAMKVSRVVMVLLLTIIMCFISGAIAVRKLKDADPADIF